MASTAPNTTAAANPQHSAAIQACLARIECEKRKPRDRRDKRTIHRALNQLHHLSGGAWFLTDDAPRGWGPAAHPVDFGRQGHHHELPIADELGREHLTLTDFATAIDTANHWTEPGEASQAAHDQRFADAADLLGVILRWLAEARELNSMALRSYALITVCRPDLISERGSRISIAKKLGVTKAALGKYCSAVYRLAHGIFQKGQQQGADYREQRRRIAIAGHRRLGHQLHGPRKPKRRLNLPWAK